MCIDAMQAGGAGSSGIFRHPNVSTSWSFVLMVAGSSVLLPA